MAKTDEQRYMIVMDGAVMVGVERAMVIKKLSRLFGTTADDVDAMLNGEPLIIKKNLPARRAHQYFRTITNAGAACHLEEFSAATEDGTGKTHSFRESDLHSSDSDSISDTTEVRDRVKKQIEERIHQLEANGQFQIDELATRKSNDKIIFLFLILLIFGLLAAIYLIV